MLAVFLLTPAPPFRPCLAGMQHPYYKCLQPLGDPAKAPTPLVYGNQGCFHRFLYLPNGAIQHAASGTCMHPQHWPPSSWPDLPCNLRYRDDGCTTQSTPILLAPGCEDSPHLKFNLTEASSGSNDKEPRFKDPLGMEMKLSVGACLDQRCEQTEDGNTTLPLDGCPAVLTKSPCGGVVPKFRPTKLVIPGEVPLQATQLLAGQCTGYCC